MSLDSVQRYALEQLRNARAMALEDAEGFPEILYALERIGTALSGVIEGLDYYKPYIRKMADASPLASDLSLQQRYGQTEFDRLYEVVRRARNEALHHGVFARHLTRHAVELCLLLEDGLMVNARLVRDFMVRDPVCAALWQPLSLIRQQMLANSFSFLPVLREDGTYGLVADLAIARPLIRTASNGERKRMLAMSLSDASKQEHVEIAPAATASPDEQAHVALGRGDGRPLLVLDEDNRLLGILTPFDLL